MAQERYGMDTIITNKKIRSCSHEIKQEMENCRLEEDTCQDKQNWNQGGRDLNIKKGK